MRALVCRSFEDGDTPQVSALPAPQATADQVAIDVHAAGVAYVDALMVHDRHQNKHALPFAPGMAVAGRIADGQGSGDAAHGLEPRSGDAAHGLEPGARVIALVYDGGLAERAVAPAAETFAIPDDVDFTTAACIASAYLTPHAALHWEAQLAAGESLLVLGAGGTVGSAAVATGAALGATVIACASSDAKLALARRHGAAHTINYASDDLRTRVRDIAGERGVDVIFDPVGGELHESAFATLGWGGRYVVVGFAGGAIPQFAANRLLVKNRKAIGFVLMYYRRYRRDRLRETAAQLFALHAAGQLDPRPDRVIALEEAAEAIDAFWTRRAVGTTVARVRDA